MTAGYPSSFSFSAEFPPNFSILSLSLSVSFLLVLYTVSFYYFIFSMNLFLAYLSLNYSLFSSLLL